MSHAISVVHIHLPEPESSAPSGIFAGGHQVRVVDQSKVVVQVQRGSFVVIAVSQLDVASAIVVTAWFACDSRI